MAIPVLKPTSTWFTPTNSAIKRNIITTINIVDSYSPPDTVLDSWDASASQDNSIICYVDGTILTIAGNGSGKILTNENSGFMFSDEDRVDFFTNVTTVNGLNLLDTSNTTTMNRMFLQMQSVTSLDVSGFNTSKVTDFSMMFAYCYVITNIPLSNFDTSSATSLYAMFFRCWILPTIDVSNFDTRNVTDISYTFDECKMLEVIDVSKWDTSKVTTLFLTFQQCNVVKELDVSNWDVSNVTNMGFTFYNCDGLTTLSVENWNVSNVENFDHTFAHCNNLVVDVSKWKTSSKCKYYSAMFHSNANEYLDVSGFDTSGAVSLFSMFEANYKLKAIKGLDGFDTSNCHAFEEMFNNCYLLEELDLSSFDTRKADSDTPARSDGSTYKSQCTSGMIIGCRGLKKIVLGKNFTFEGDGTSAANKVSYLPTPSSKYIDGADGNWYAEDGTVYIPADVPNLTYSAYYVTEDLATTARNSKKYVSLNGLNNYNDAIKTHINNIVSDKISIPGGGSITLEDIFGEPPYTIEITDDEDEFNNISVAPGVDYDVYRLRNVAILTEVPTVMNDGDIALVINIGG